MSIVGMVQMAVDEIVDVISVGDGFVAAAWTVDVVLVVSSAAVLRGARAWVGVGHLDHVVIDAFTFRMMEMPIVQIVDVVAVLNGHVATVLPVLVVVIFAVVIHCSFLL